MLPKIKQRQLVGFGQPLQKSKICHQVDDRLTELAALAEIVFGKEPLQKENVTTGRNGRKR